MKELKSSFESVPKYNYFHCISVQLLIIKITDTLFLDKYFDKFSNNSNSIIRWNILESFLKCHDYE